MKQFGADKRAQGLSMNVIIIAVIALVVLVVIVIILTGSAGDFIKRIGTKTYCETAPEGQITVNGHWASECSEDEQRAYGSFEDSQNRQN